MIGRIVEVATDGVYLCRERGFLVVRRDDQELGRVPLDDVAGLICSAHGLTTTTNLLVALAERTCPVVLCGANHMPAGILWPTHNHHQQASHLDRQLGATLPLRKRLWQQVVRAKLSMQAEALGLCGRPKAPLQAMVRKVRAGDPSNVEAHGSRAYWSLMFGKDFRRDHDADGINSLLNYGYAVLRATVARYVMATGLHPGLPIHHSNAGNPMRLIDDLMEPFRPLVDVWVRRLANEDATDVTPATKRVLATLPTRSLLTETGTQPVTLVIRDMCTSLTQVFAGERDSLLLPAPHTQPLAAIWDEPREEESDEEGD